jgi:hypothetical protein
MTIANTQTWATAQSVMWHFVEIAERSGVTITIGHTHILHTDSHIGLPIQQKMEIRVQTPIC